MESLNEILADLKRRRFPQSLQIQVWKNHKKILDIKQGRRFEFFDLASITKILVSTSLMMKLVEAGLIKLEDHLELHLPFLVGTRIGKIKIKNLLRHESGLAWWKPYFKVIKRSPQSMKRAELERLLRSEGVRPTKKCVYSDLDFMLVGLLIEEKFEMPLDEAARIHVFKKLGLINTSYGFSGRKGRVAPTEVTKLRGKIQGVVHDENAWSLGGVAGHAGVFSTIDDLAKYGNEILRVYLKKRGGFASPHILRNFTKRSVPSSRGDWALGFTVPTKGKSSGGKKISSNAFGHLGFTGTSLWIDPRRKAVVAILSNRTYPSRKDERFPKLRQRLHDALWEIVDGEQDG